MSAYNSIALRGRPLIPTSDTALGSTSPVATFKQSADQRFSHSLTCCPSGTPHFGAEATAAPCVLQGKPASAIEGPSADGTSHAGAQVPWEMARADLRGRGAAQQEISALMTWFGVDVVLRLRKSPIRGLVA